MRRFLLVMLLAAVCLAADNDWLIVPGERVGPITGSTSRADLTRLFGAANLKDEKIHLVEGEYAPGTWVYPKDVKKRLAVIWKDKARTRIELIKITGSVSEWRTVDGITLGMRLSKLETINGKPFSFSGFGWDYGGNVVGFDGGALDAEKHNLPLQLSDDTSRAKQLTQEQRESLLGDQTLRSDNALVRKLDPWVCQMVVTFKS